MTNNGVPIDRIYDGLYGSDEQILLLKSCQLKEKVIIFAGRLVLKRYLSHFRVWFSPGQFEHWRLEIYGNGPLLNDIVQTERLKVSKFISANVSTENGHSEDILSPLTVIIGLWL